MNRVFFIIVTIVALGASACCYWNPNKFFEIRLVEIFNVVIGLTIALFVGNYFSKDLHNFGRRKDYLLRIVSDMRSKFEKIDTILNAQAASPIQDVVPFIAQISQSLSDMERLATKEHDFKGQYYDKNIIIRFYDYKTAITAHWPDFPVEAKISYTITSQTFLQDLKCLEEGILTKFQ